MLMKQKKMLVLTFSQLKQIYTQEMPELVEMAAVSPTVEDFKAGLLKHLDSCGMVNEVAEEAREQIRLLLQYDGQDVHELSTGQDISVQTIRLLYQFLTEKLENIEMPTDLFIELFQLFKRLQGETVPLPSPQRIKSRNDRWDTGLDEEVRERGNNFSAGQRQLLSFARAVLADPAIFVLDEATSSIDTKTEQLIQQATDKLLKGRTSFLIAHRLSTIRNADLILVVRDGKIVEQGKHKELLAKKGYYYQLVRQQFADEESRKVLS